MCCSEDYDQKELWRRKFPAIIAAFLSVFQMIFTAVIVGCEIGGDFINFSQMNIFVGYWTFPFFMCAWISLAGASCCCRSRCCGITTLVFQCLAIPMALCVIGFDAYFLNNPTQCFFSNDCSSYEYSYNTYSTNSGYFYSIKVPLIKGQLAAGALMFVSSVIFIIIFAVTSYRVSKATQSDYVPPVSVAIAPTSTQYVPPSSKFTQPNTSGGNPIESPYANRRLAPPSNVPVVIPTNPTVPKTQLNCPHCKTSFHIAT